MDVQTDSSGTVTVTDIDQDGRRFLAMRSLRVRLRFAIRMGRTDSFAMHSARGWAEQGGYTGSLKTMKQALRWVESQC